MGGGIIALPLGVQTRYSRFWQSLVGLNITEDDAHCFSVGTNVCEGRNRACRELLEQPQYEWVMFLDDDHTFPRGTLEGLLSWKPPNDIVSACPIQKTPPYGSISFDEVQDGEHTRFRRITFPELPTKGLFEVDALGFGCVVVRRRVIEAMEDPWFEFGHWASNQMQEDVYFCHKARKRGFRVFMDCALRAGHIQPVVVNRSKDGLGVELELGGIPLKKIAFHEPTLMEQ